MEPPEELSFTWMMVIGISLTFTLALAVILFFVYYQRRLHQHQLAMEQLKVEEQTKRLAHTIDAQEQERERIARDLHDEVGALLSTMKLYLTHSSEAPEGMEAKAIAVLDQTIDCVRGIAQNLSTGYLQTFGLSKAIEHTCARLEDASELEFNYSDSLPQRLPQALEVHLLRIVQELLNNTIKHSQATQVSIALSASASQANLSYSDNGRGFEVNQQHQGLGLNSLSGRASLIHGTLNMQSSPGKGMQATINVPLSTSINTETSSL